MVWILVGAALLLIVLVCKCIPVGELHGRKVMLVELASANTRLQLQVSKAQAALDACEELPPQQRLGRLLELERDFGQVFIVGERIRTAIIATGVNDAARHLRGFGELRHGGIHVTGGVRDALKSGVIEDDFRVQAFQFLMEGLDHPDLLGVSRGAAPGLLLELDEEWAARVLRGPEYMDVRHEVFGEVLEALNEHAIPVERSQVDAWLRHYGGRSLDYSEGCDYVEVLKALFFHDRVLAEGLLTEELDKNTPAAEKAAETLLFLHDLPHPVYGLDDLEQKLGQGALTPAEQTVWLATTYAYLLSFEGLSQLDRDERADPMADMHRALQQIGAVRQAQRLADYMALYGKDGVPPTAAARQAFIEKAGPAWQKSVEAVQERDDLEEIRALAMRFELAHAGQFRTRSVIQELLKAGGSAA